MSLTKTSQVELKSGRLDVASVTKTGSGSAGKWTSVSPCIQASRMARTCVEESLAFARTRKTFGKFLIEHQAWGFSRICTPLTLNLLLLRGGLSGTSIRPTLNLLLLLRGPTQNKHSTDVQSPPSPRASV